MTRPWSAPASGCSSPVARDKYFTKSTTFTYDLQTRRDRPSRFNRFNPLNTDWPVAGEFFGASIELDNYSQVGSNEGRMFQSYQVTDFHFYLPTSSILYSTSPHACCATRRHDQPCATRHNNLPRGTLDPLAQPFRGLVPAFRRDCLPNHRLSFLMSQSNITLSIRYSPLSSGCIIQ